MPPFATRSSGWATLLRWRCCRPSRTRAELAAGGAGLRRRRQARAACAALPASSTPTPTTSSTNASRGRSTRCTSPCPTPCTATTPCGRPTPGVHVLCEKPMAVTVEECEAMIEACAETRREADDRLPPALRGGEPRRPSRWSARGGSASRRSSRRRSRSSCDEDNVRSRRPSEGGGHAVRHRHLLHQRRPLPVPRRARSR